MKIAIVGHGFVGAAVDYGFTHPNVEKIIVDPKYDGSNLKHHYNSIEDLKNVYDIDAIFICVPTPMKNNGKVDSSVVADIVKKVLRHQITGMIIIKSTITPDIAKTITKHPWIIYNPEFLMERTSKSDFVNPPMHVFGGDPKFGGLVKNLYDNYSMCKPCPVFYMSASEASFVKYGINTYLATKVLWFNQFYDVVTKRGSNFNKVINAMTADSRIGESHTTVPGFDDKRGYGGACFPKDTQALYNYDKSFSLLGKVIEDNNEYRKDYDLDDREVSQNVSFQ